MKNEDVKAALEKAAMEIESAKHFADASDWSTVARCVLAARMYLGPVHSEAADRLHRKRMRRSGGRS